VLSVVIKKQLLRRVAGAQPILGEHLQVEGVDDAVGVQIAGPRAAVRDAPGGGEDSEVAERYGVAALQVRAVRVADVADAVAIRIPLRGLKMLGQLSSESGTPSPSASGSTLTGVTKSRQPKPFCSCCAALVIVIRPGENQMPAETRGLPSELPVLPDVRHELAGQLRIAPGQAVVGADFDPVISRPEPEMAMPRMM